MPCGRELINAISPTGQIAVLAMPVDAVVLFTTAAAAARFRRSIQPQSETDYRVLPNGRPPDPVPALADEGGGDGGRK